MKRLMCVPAVLAVIAMFALVSRAAACPIEDDGGAIFPFPVQRSTLDNGLDVISVQYDSPGIIAYYTVVRTGSRNEVEPGLSGFAHFFEHMMFRGTPRYSETQYNDTLKGLGADFNAFTTDDWTCYHITASADALETVIDLEADRFQNLKYNEADFQKEARAVLGEYNKSASSPFLLLDEKMQDTAYTRHTYKHTTIGFLKDIEDMPNQYAYSRTFFDRWYRPENCIVLVVGDVDHDELEGLARQHYGGWKRGSATVEIPTEPQQTEERTLDLSWPGQTLPYLYVGYHVPGFDAASRDIAALDVLAEAYFSATSPLYRKLVLDERKVEFISAGAAFRRDPTLFTVLARITAPDHIAAVRREIYDTFRAAAETPIADERLDAIKSHMRYAFAMSMKTPNDAAQMLGEYLQLTGDPDAVNQMYDTYAAVTAQDIQRVARKYFAATNRTAITLRQAAPGAGKTERPGADSVAARGVPVENRSRHAAEPDAPALRERIPAAAAAACALESDDDTAGIRPGNAPPSETILLNPQSPLVAIRIQVNAGSRNDPAGKEGLAALTARMLVRGGTKRFSYDQILEQLYPMAAEVGSNCDKEVTVFAADVHRDKLDQFYDLFHEMLTDPRFDTGDFERLREEQLNFVSKILRGNNDEELGKWTLQLMLYPDHPYGHVDAGTVSGLQSITLDDVKDFYRRQFAPLSARMQIGLAGGADPVFADRLRRDFRSLPTRAPELAELPPPHVPDGIELTIVQKDCIATAISIGYPLDITRSDDDFYPLAVANSALGEHRTFNGRLMQNMRGKRGLNYGDYSYIENFIQDGGSTFPVPNVPRRQQYFSIWIRPVPHDKAVFALRQAIRELDRMVEAGLGEEEFDTTRRFVLGYSKMWVQTQSRRLGYEMDGAFYGRASLVTELDRRLPELTRDEVNAAVRRRLQSRNLCVAIVTQDAKALRDAILSGDPSPLRYDTEGTPKEILEEDKQIESYPLRVNADRVRIVPAERMFE